MKPENPFDNYLQVSNQYRITKTYVKSLAMAAMGINQNMGTVICH